MSKTIKIAGAGMPEEEINSLIAQAIDNARDELRLEALMAENPVGHIRFELTNINPATYLGFGTWELWGAGQVPIGVDATNTAINGADKKTGSASVTVTSASTTPGATGAATGTTDSTTPGATGAATGNTGAAAGSTDSTTPGATGAATGDTGSTAITIAQMPSHNHSFTGSSHNHTLTAHTHSVPSLSVTTYSGGDHAHTGRYRNGYTLGGNNYLLRRISDEDAWTADATVTYTGGAHSHTGYTGTGTTGSSSDGIAAATQGGTVGNNGSGTGHVHTLNNHTHTSAAHSHGLGSHTHTLGSHTHTSAAHTHGLGNHTHTSAAHTHSVTISTTQPSISCYMWRRVA